ncbi:hypothetical protein HDU98_012230 [Podochytrium sp. JEL0797]|nr:hypothetical protein HDU98_012230 [Podochytrium sp. JEL0797]
MSNYVSTSQCTGSSYTVSLGPSATGNQISTLFAVFQGYLQQSCSGLTSNTFQCSSPTGNCPTAAYLSNAITPLINQQGYISSNWCNGQFYSVQLGPIATGFDLNAMQTVFTHKLGQYCVGGNQYGAFWCTVSPLTGNGCPSSTSLTAAVSSYMTKYISTGFCDGNLFQVSTGLYGASASTGWTIPYLANAMQALGYACTGDMSTGSSGFFCNVMNGACPTSASLTALLLPYVV